MFMPYARFALILFILNLGIALGAGLYESRITAAHWLVQSPAGEMHWHAEAAVADNVGVRFWAFVTTGPFTLLTLINLWIAIWRAQGRLRQWWLGSALLSLAERVFTIGYFIPAMITLMSAADSPQSVNDAQTWMNLNYLRHALLLGAWIAAMQTYALSQNVKRRSPSDYEPHTSEHEQRRRKRA
jgi:hypothetical protein